MFFSLDVLRARKGDCLMLHYGSERRPASDADRRRPFDWSIGPHLEAAYSL